MNRKLDFDDVVTLVGTERAYQDSKHGTIEANPHHPATWLLLIEAELREARDAIIKGPKAEGRDTWTAELIQVAALCIAAIEQHGMHDQRNGERAIPRLPASDDSVKVTYIEPVFTPGKSSLNWCSRCDKHRSLHRGENDGDPEFCSNANRVFR